MIGGKCENIIDGKCAKETYEKYREIMKSRSMAEKVKEKYEQAQNKIRLEPEQDITVTSSIESESKQKRTRKNILAEAEQCVCGNREQDYGTPENNFSLVADFWSKYLDTNITPQDVAMLMILLKVARIKNGGGSGDSFVDIAGYAACAGEINGR